MKTQTTLEKSNGATPRLGNLVHHLDRRLRDPHQLSEAQVNAVIAHRYSCDGIVCTETTTDSAGSVSL